MADRLCHGLRNAGVPFTLNPSADALPFAIVHVLSGLDTLKWAVSAKKRGLISRLIAGPTVVSTPDEAGGLIADRSIDQVICASDWVAQMFCHFEPALNGRVEVWPIGVDTSAWKPIRPATERSIDLLVYDKLEAPVFRQAGLVPPWSPQERSQFVDSWRSRGLRVRTLTYGTHTPDEYLAALEDSRAMLYLSFQETQGIALLEAWSCDVPTLVWDRRVWNYNGLEHVATTSPWLTPACGKTFCEPCSIAEALMSFMEPLASGYFCPRATVESRYSLSDSIKSYTGLIQSGGATPACHTVSSVLKD